jgi:sulfotransferase family protein
MPSMRRRTGPGEAGMTPRIDVDSLLEFAHRKTGFSDLGKCGDILVEGWRCLAKGIGDSRSYNAIGMHRLNEEFLWWIETHLRFEADLDRHPEICDVPVAEPIFIADFGRAGSTFLHNLLALDVRARTPALWEMWNPSPPPSRNADDEKARIAAANSRIEVIRRTAPMSMRIHPLSAQGPEECQWIVPHGTHLAMQHQALGYWEWLRQLDEAALRALLGYYRLRVQHLQLFHRREYWLSKSMTHLYYLPVLLDVFPDARVICLHRDPRQAVPSMCSLYRSIRYSLGRHDANAELGKLVMEIFVDSVGRMMETDRRHDPGRFVDVHFTDLAADPVGTVRRIYGQIGLSCAEFYVQAVEAYAAASDSGRHAHSYRAEDFGLTDGEIAERAGDYLCWLDGKRVEHRAA